MMKKTYLALACVILAPMFLTSVSSSAPYDPWCDLDENGAINIFDVVRIAGSYGMTGDPGKNVTVTNWPVSKQQTVCYGRTWGGVSHAYNASGFSQMHMSWTITGLVAPENVTISIQVYIYEEGVGHVAFPVEEFVVTELNQKGTWTIPVPSEKFEFYFTFAPGTTAWIYFAFYLTWS